ncbi:MAG: hypothetical protein U0798_10190 [Gemmataceae bacterium]
MDLFEVLINTEAIICWPNGGGFQPAEVRINGNPLIDLIRKAEEPWTLAEYMAQQSELPNKDEYRLAPGDYHYLSCNRIFKPSQEWLGVPSKLGFVLDDEDPRRGKAMVLGCTCGISECWFVQARIEVRQNTVHWSDFGQFHRPSWCYDLGPFIFDREQYESQLDPRCSEQTSVEDAR